MKSPGAGYWPRSCGWVMQARLRTCTLVRHMRILMEVKLPLEPFNSYVRDGSAGARMQKILADAKPEAAYYGDRVGHRGGYCEANMDDPSEVPARAEPWCVGFNAHVEFSVVRTPEDLGKAGLEALGKKWG